MKILARRSSFARSSHSTKLSASKRRPYLISAAKRLHVGDHILWNHMFLHNKMRCNVARRTLLYLRLKVGSDAEELGVYNSVL